MQRVCCSCSLAIFWSKVQNTQFFTDSSVTATIFLIMSSCDNISLFTVIVAFFLRSFVSVCAYRITCITHRSIWVMSVTKNQQKRPSYVFIYLVFIVSVADNK